MQILLATENKNISQKCLKHWNAVVSTSVDERNNATSANQQSSSTKLRHEMNIQN